MNSHSSSSDHDEAASLRYTHPPVRPEVPQYGYLGYPTGFTRPNPLVTPPHVPADVSLTSVLPVAIVADEPPKTAGRESAFVRAWRKLGGGSLAFSLVVHGALLVLACLIVFTVREEKNPPLFVPAGPTKAGPRVDSLPGKTRVDKKRASLGKTPLTCLQVDRPKDFHLPEITREVVEVGSSYPGLAGRGELMGDAGTIDRIRRGAGDKERPKGGSPLPIPRLIQARCSAHDRLERLRETGGGPECERAVSQSLAWLKTRQNPDGSWGRANKCAMTGLALLCYLGRCETPDSPFYGDTVMNGLLYLIEASKRNPEGFITENASATAGAYEHGIATYALGEMYAFARLGSRSLPGMKDTFEKGVSLIIRAQNAEGAGGGSWDYYTRNVAEGRWHSSREDLSVTGWQYQALKAAKNVGAKIDGLHPAIDRCVRYLERKQTKDGGIGGLQRDAAYNQWSLTGAGVLGMQTLGSSGRKQAISRAMKFLHSYLADEPLDWNRNCNLYSWYYYTQAFFQAGGDEWRFYNAMLLPQLLTAQQADGSFRRGRASMPIADAADDILRQTLCTLQLEVYYRYLRVADREAGSLFDR